MTAKISTAETIENEIKRFANGLPYWSKYLADLILAGKDVSDKETASAYGYLLEDLGLKEKQEKPDITINCTPKPDGDYKTNLRIQSLKNIEGVNALANNQLITFDRNLTIVYGANGSGKSGYVRLFKKAFYSKSPEDILPNIHLDEFKNSISAEFQFSCNGEDLPSVVYPAGKDCAEFEQFSVFDGKSAISQITQKNAFEFRPAGLKFFSDFTNAIVKVEEKLQAEIKAKKTGITPLVIAEIFPSESSIKTLIKGMSSQTLIEDIKKHTPYTAEDKDAHEKLQKQYDELLISEKDSISKIKTYQGVKKALSENKAFIEKLNKCFSNEFLLRVKTAISDCVEKLQISTDEGSEKFKIDDLIGIGSQEWRAFIKAAEIHANQQTIHEHEYPVAGDKCLLCHQVLSESAALLISSYWQFLRSAAEENAKNSQALLDKMKAGYDSLNYDLFPSDSILTIWLLETQPIFLEEIQTKIAMMKSLSIEILESINKKSSKEWSDVQIDLREYEKIDKDIDDSIKLIENPELAKEIAILLADKTYLEHKETLNTHLASVLSCLNNQIWLAAAESFTFPKRKITDAEKTLSDQVFNQEYVKVFNLECQKLNGKFGIEIIPTASSGKSYRQLKLKGRSPNAILSEGEQKVIAIADFIAEMQLSPINQGVIYDDPVTSLDDTRKKEIALRLIEQSNEKQVVVFTHDLMFVSLLTSNIAPSTISYACHWIEKRGNDAGYIWLNNSPSYEKSYRNADIVRSHYKKANSPECPPESREMHLRNGFTSLRTCYEVLVINDLFKNVVQRFNERVSVDSIKSVCFDEQITDELYDNYSKCCRYMEGHSHSDKYSFKKAEPADLQLEIDNYESIRSKIKAAKRKTP